MYDLSSQVNCDEENCVDCRGGYAFNFDGTPKSQTCEDACGSDCCSGEQYNFAGVFYGPCDQFSGIVCKLSFFLTVPIELST